MKVPRYIEGITYNTIERDDYFRFECKRCGSCCALPPPVLPQEIERLSSYMNMDRQGFFRSFCRASPHTGLLNLRKSGDHCTLYIDGGICMLHESKPGSCRSLPIKARYVFSGDADDVDHPERIVLAMCRGMLDGPIHLVSEFMDEFCPPDHISNHAAVMKRFVDHMGGIERANMLMEDGSFITDMETRRLVREFTEREYGIWIPE